MFIKPMEGKESFKESFKWKKVRENLEENPNLIDSQRKRVLERR